MQAPEIDIESLKEKALKDKIREMIMYPSEKGFSSNVVGIDQLTDFLYSEVVKPAMEREKFLQITPLGMGKVGKK